MTHTLPNDRSGGALPEASTTVQPNEPLPVDHDDLKVTSVAALMSPLDPIIEGTHSLRQAAELITLSDEAFAVVKLNGAVVGILSAGDVLAAAQRNPTGWQTQPCTTGIPADQGPILAHQSVVEVLAEYRRTGVRTLLVCQRNEALGLLRSVDVRTWCQEHDPPLWEDLFSDDETHKSDSGEADTR